MTKREQIYAKFNGKCAYTGKLLDDKWQIDHMIPKCWKHYSTYYNKSLNDIENLMPVLWIVNHYKRSLGIDGFRNYMLTFHKRLAKVPKYPYSSRGIRRKVYMQQVADAFGITPDSPFDGIFYFEREGK